MKSSSLRLAMLSPVAWRTPPKAYGPWERVVSLLTEGLVKRGVDVTLFATGDSITAGKLHAVCPVGYEEDKEVNRRVWECLHISEVFEHASDFNLIHNHFDFLPLSYSDLITTPIVTTIHGFSSPTILPVYQKYNGRAKYISISNADRDPSLDYIATVYHGIDIENFTYQAKSQDYLIFFGRIHSDKGAREAIEIAKQSNRRLIMAGIIQDEPYFRREIEPYIDDQNITYAGNVGPEKRDQLLGNAAALLHPINFDEPFGLSVVEAMACGTPVIAFQRGSMSELIVPYKTGFLVQTITEAVQAVNNLSNINRRNCRLHIEENFSTDQMVTNYLKVYTELLSS